MENNYKSHIENSYINAENYNSKINDEILSLEGASGAMTRHFYNNLLNINDARYLEIGTWRGSTVCSAMYNNNATVVCIDNWSQFGGIDNKDIFITNFEKYKGNNNATFIEKDCFSIDLSLLPKFNIYMYDGEHTYATQYKALTYYYNALDEIFIYIVDDWNLDFIRSGTKDAIRDLNLQILYEKEIRLSNDDTYTHDTKGWWNGIYFALLQKTN